MDQLEIPDPALARLDLGNRIPRDVPAHPLTLRREGGLGQPVLVAQTANLSPYNVSASSHDVLD